MPLSGPAWPMALVKQSAPCPGLSPGTCTARASPLLAWNFLSLQSPRTAWWGHKGTGGPGSEDPHTLGCSFSALLFAAGRDPSVRLLLPTAVVPWGASRGSGPRDGVGSRGCGPEGRHTQSCPCLSHWTSRQTQVLSLQAFAADSLPGSWDTVVMFPGGELRKPLWHRDRRLPHSPNACSRNGQEHLVKETCGAVCLCPTARPCEQWPISELVPSPHHMDHPSCPPRCCLGKDAHFG